MKIPTEVLQQYGVSTNHLEDELTTYQTFLNVTDRNILEGLESCLEEPNKFVKNAQELSRTISDLVGYRKIAREEIKVILTGDTSEK